MRESQLESCEGDTPMNQCKNHPNSEAVAKCSRCGNLICDECAGYGDGSLLCLDCHGVQRTQNQDSFWVESSLYKENEHKIHRYLLFGVIGSVLWLFANIGTLSLYWFMWSNPIEIYFVWMSFLSLFLSLLSIAEPILLGLGFLGLYYKYDVGICQYVLWANIAGVIFNFGFSFALPALYSANIYFSGITQISVSFLIMLVTVIALWQIRDRTRSPSLVILLSIALLMSVPLSLLVVFLLPYSILLSFISPILNVFIAIGMMIFFVLERSMKKSISSSW